ncbi:hypothetical protein CMV_009442 [Castanea mollissima]|uniref:Uncharacterized protein n=1 Tax=Castanea mollissima TaxID=60419 RepID=A0A8J4R5M7_9ROSI|nr:hypothetical protein CMV_009442 [Castanea mollissima]
MMLVDDIGDMTITEDAIIFLWLFNDSNTAPDKEDLVVNKEKGLILSSISEMNNTKRLAVNEIKWNDSRGVETMGDIGYRSVASVDPKGIGPKPFPSLVIAPLQLEAGCFNGDS